MTVNKVTITPTRELIGEWMMEEYGYSTAIDLEEMKLSIAKHAAQWGADCELDACCEWLSNEVLCESNVHRFLRAARRPKPPSLKKQALKRLAEAELTLIVDPDRTIRRALESIPEDQ